MQARTEKPLYLRLSEAILEKYRHLDYYSPLPGERELGEIFHTSRPTIRKAIDVLEKEGKIIRLQGKGTFYLGDESHVDHQMNSIIGFYNDVKLQGKITRSKILLQNVEPASKAIAEKLEIKEGDLVFHLERLRYIDGELYCLTNSYHPMEYCPDLRKVDFTERSLYNTLEEYGIYLAKMRQTLEVKAANAYEALQLEIREGDSISVWSSITYDTDDRIVEYVQVKTQAYKTKYEIMVYNDKAKK
ncbi:MAG: GntR family transcriptional regulator [Lachnospiraceae bacterium]|nr:GntR family transcriptional regulator [Lachnospiraceae bacterium]